MGERRDDDVLVAGAGPAGIAAAVRAAEAGASVTLVDDNPTPGGQIWRGEASRAHDPLAGTWLGRLARAGVHILTSAQIVDASAPTRLIVDSPIGRVDLRGRHLILATGARELFLPFPGWTLPNVLGAGGLQSLVKGGLPIASKVVVVAGSGPLLLAVAAYLRSRGAVVPLVGEQAPLRRVLRFGLDVLRTPAKTGQTLLLGYQLRGIRYIPDTWPIAAEPTRDRLRVTLRRGGARWPMTCDFLACGFGLLPNLELPRLLGCQISDGTVAVDRWQRTSIEGVFCVGEPTGVGGLEKALVEGEIAGYLAGGQHDAAQALFGRRRSTHRFARALDRAFRPRDELRQITRPETIVCRCEDVALSSLQLHDSWRAAKLQTRCGMGACQGRICGGALRYLFGWEDDSPRPPLFPTPLGSLVGVADSWQQRGSSSVDQPASPPL